MKTPTAAQFNLALSFIKACPVESSGLSKNHTCAQWKDKESTGTCTMLNNITAIGFGPAGPIAGSLATTIQSSIGAAVPAGSVFATLQSAGMGGAGAAALGNAEVGALIAGALSAGAAAGGEN